MIKFEQSERDKNGYWATVGDYHLFYTGTGEGHAWRLEHPSTRRVVAEGNENNYTGAQIEVLKALRRQLFSDIRSHQQQITALTDQLQSTL